LDEELVAEGIAREFVNRVQNMRKEAGLEVSDRIQVGVIGDSGIETPVEKFRAYISGETLAASILVGSLPKTCVLKQECELNGLTATIGISKV
jgi:isoleucyl-tRNA synthetase